METNNVTKERSLIDLVLSWSIKDVLNNDLYTEQVKQIPKTFSSSQEYLESFINPLIEETRMDLSSSFSTLSESFCSEIESVEQSKDFKLPNSLCYTITLEKDQDKKKKKDNDDDDDDDDDEHGVGDIIALTNVRPKSRGDLERPGWPYLIAYVYEVSKKKEESGVTIKLSVQSSKLIFIGDDMENSEKSGALYAVKLINLTTNLRIWNALHSNPESANWNIIQKVLQPPFVDTEDCTLCQREENCVASYSETNRSDLNEPQKAAVLSCIGTTACHHENTVKLIWGPPGTGKTKTVGFLLHSLLKMSCKTLTCAPTNIAVLEVTKRLVNGVRESYARVGYGLGNIVLFGNKKRMKIKNHKDLHDIFLDHRIEVLRRCYDSSFGWNASLIWMISLLHNPEQLYHKHISGIREKMPENSSEGAEKKNVSRNQNENENKKKTEEDDRLKKVRKQVNQHLEANKKNKTKQIEDVKTEEPLTFAEFVKKKFNFIAEHLYFCIENLYKHLPTSYISLELVEKMFEASFPLKRFQNVMRTISDEELLNVFRKGSMSREDRFKRFSFARNETLASLKLLPSELPKLESTDKKFAGIKQFCLETACLIFCTVSGSAKLHQAGLENPFKLVVIDEAAQLKECESAIPLQLHGIHHAFLIGDEKQLPAMVQSKICEEADFGRSLFERLALLGHKKLLLGVQHRMHPSISLFPNREFYDRKIKDGPNVTQNNYNRRFLPGEMYGSYSFINVPHGKEAFDNKHSRKNTVEIAVVSNIVATLYKEFLRTKKPVRVGVISPYKAQVHAISERFGKRYGSDAQSHFSVRVRSVDGFQGGEEDVIIISTVRSNPSGSIGFLSNRQRANVALTRARYCLWLVGSGTTLGNSNSVWKKLIIDAKERNCFYNAEEDPSLAQAVIAALLELNHIDVLATAESLLFRSAKWKVCFTREFWRSMGRSKNDELHKKVFSLLEKLSSGWRQQEKISNVVAHGGSSSLFVEHYEVTEKMCLIWAVDVLLERSYCTQVLKVWDFLPVSKLQMVAGQLDVVYGSYTIDKMSRCKHKLNDGDLVVPMTWPVDSGAHKTNHSSSLSKPMASLSLRDKPETSSTNSRPRKEPNYQKRRPNIATQTWQVSRRP